MKFFSMFSGIGGFDLALEREGFECVGCSDIDKHASAVYAQHWPQVKNYGNATKIDADELPDFELLVGGFPCQSFSLAGHRKGFDDQRGTLFFEIARLAEIKRPAHLLLENVKGLLSSGGGYCFASILSRLEELGFLCEWQVLNTKWWLPQNRERVFIHCFRKGSGKAIFPLTESNPIFDTSNEREREERPGIQGEISSTIDARYSALRNSGETYVRACLTPDRAEKRQNGRRFKDEGEPSFSLTAQDKHDILISPIIRAEHHNCADVHFVPQESSLRRLTPTECERLQGFPDSWTEKVIFDGKEKEVSNSQRYKMLGNAVTVNVVQAIARNLK